LALGALLLSALALGGCANTMAQMPVVGVPADAPAPPKEAGDYLPVEDLPPARDDAALAPAEQDKIRAELMAARDHQAAVTTGTSPAPKPHKGIARPNAKNKGTAKQPDRARTAGAAQ
jgi:hypothetical protein